MKAPRRLLVTGLTALVLIVLLLMLPGRRETTLTIGVFTGSSWDSSSDQTYDLLARTIERFEASHPGVKVRCSTGIPYSEYEEWLSERLLMGDEPDVFFVLDNQLRLLRDLGALLPLDRYAQEDAAVAPDTFYPATYAAGQIDGSLYALPYECAPTMMFVNRTLLETCGLTVPEDNWTWSDFYRIAQAIAAYAEETGEDIWPVLGYTWEHAVLSNGARLFNDTGTVSNFSDPRVRSAIEFSARMDSLTGGYAIDAEAFLRGDVAFCPMVFSTYRAEKTSLWNVRSFAGFEWDCIAMPAGPLGANISELNTLLMGISARSDHPALAWELLRTMVSDPESQQDVCTMAAGLSPRPAVVQSFLAQPEKGGKHLSALQNLDQILSQCVPQPSFRHYDTAMRYAGSEILQILQDPSDLGNSLLQLQRRMNELLLE